MPAAVSEKKPSILKGPCGVRKLRAVVVGFFIFNAIAILCLLPKQWQRKNSEPRDALEGCHVQGSMYTDILHDVFHLPLHRNRAMNTYYFPANDQWCFWNGTFEDESRKSRKCVCRSNFHGKDCGIPGAVWRSSFLKSGTKAGAWVRRRERPRRIVSVFLADLTQFDLVKLQLDYLGSVVDAFVVGHVGTELLNKIQAAYNKSELYKKIVSVDLKEKKGALLLDQMWRRVSDFRLDDLFLWTDPATVPFAETVLFMKLYDGFNEPVRFFMRDLSHSFLWQKQKYSRKVEAVHLSTFALVHSLCRFNHLCSLSGDVPKKDSSIFAAFSKMTGWSVEPWALGDPNTPSGWNCRDCIVIPNSTETFVDSMRNGSDIPQEWLNLVAGKLKERNFSMSDVQSVSYDDTHLAPSPLLIEPGHLWYMVPYSLQYKENRAQPQRLHSE